MPKPNGYILSETDNHVVIATGFADKSGNLKTGNMIQVFIIYKHEHPWQATKSGKDEEVCFNCPLRPSIAKPLSKSVCYVKTVHAPAAVYKKYHRNGYTLLTDYSIFAGRKVRFGAYGEPVLIPFKIVKEIVNYASLYTGYSHQWQSPIFQAYKAYFMASCDETNYQLANSMGWRAFIVTNGVKRIEGSSTCPASKEMGRRVHCADCGACSGIVGKGYRNINIAVHH